MTNGVRCLFSYTMREQHTPYLLGALSHIIPMPTESALHLFVEPAYITYIGVSPHTTGDKCWL